MLMRLFSFRTGKQHDILKRDYGLYSSEQKVNLASYLASLGLNFP